MQPKNKAFDAEHRPHQEPAQGIGVGDLIAKPRLPEPANAQSQ